MYLKLFTAAAAIAVPFSLVGVDFTNDSATAARYLVKPTLSTALAANPSPRQPLPTKQVTLADNTFSPLSSLSSLSPLSPLSSLSPLSPLSPLSSSPTLIAQTTWKDFSSSEGKFAVAMPGTPKQETETDEDGLTSHSFTVEIENPDSAYLVTYYDVPEVANATPEQVKELLDGTPDAFAKGGNAQLTREQNIILDGNPGREFEFTSTEGFSGKGRVYLVQQRLFLVVAIAPQTQNIQRFLDSFRLL